MYCRFQASASLIVALQQKNVVSKNAQCCRASSSKPASSMYCTALSSAESSGLFRLGQACSGNRPGSNVETGMARSIQIASTLSCDARWDRRVCVVHFRSASAHAVAGYRTVNQADKVHFRLGHHTARCVFWPQHLSCLCMRNGLGQRRGTAVQEIYTYQLLDRRLTYCRHAGHS